jgi:hypothetical protein
MFSVRSGPWLGRPPRSRHFARKKTESMLDEGYPDSVAIRLAIARMLFHWN